jgi:hypothetical protein
MSNAKDVVLPDEFQYCLIAVSAFAAVLLIWMVVKLFFWKDESLQNVEGARKFLNFSMRWNKYHLLSGLFSVFVITASALILWERENGNIVDVEVSS